MFLADFERFCRPEGIVEKSGSIDNLLKSIKDSLRKKSLIHAHLPVFHKKITEYSTDRNLLKNKFPSFHNRP
jgi:hypothetical protein